MTVPSWCHLVPQHLMLPVQKEIQ
uniref:Uncharacterized protein n=1 Tax=Lutzomyia longipalpis TaxID=7200 RepID=A0A1B0CS64_LUTLO